MTKSRIALAVERRGKGIVTAQPLPERFRVTAADIDDLQRDAEPVLRSGPTQRLAARTGAIGTNAR